MQHKKAKSSSPLKSTGKDVVDRINRSQNDLGTIQSQTPNINTIIDNLSFNDVDSLHESSSTKGFPSFHLTEPVQSLRISITKSENEHPNPSVPSIKLNEKYSHNKRDVIVKHPLSYTGPVFQPLSLLEQLYNDSAYYDNPSLSHLQLRSFLKENFLSIVFILFDVHMQVITTLDATSRLIPTGITIGPQFLTKSRDEFNICNNHAHVVQFDLKDLPPNVFAVAPIIFNDACNVGRDQKFEYHSYLKYQATYRRNSKFDEVNGLDMHTSANLDRKIMNVLNESIKVTEFDQFGEEKRISPPQRIILSKCDGLDISNKKGINSIKNYATIELQATTPQQKRSRGSLFKGLKSDDEEDDEDSIEPVQTISQIFNTTNVKVPDEVELKWMERAWALDDGTQSRDNPGIEPNVLVNRDTCVLWGHLSSTPFIQANGDSIGPFDEQTDSFTNNTIALQPSYGIFPFALFRATEKSKGWHYKQVNHEIMNRQPVGYIQEVIETMVREKVCPYCVMHVHHCQNCESHSISTRHIPGSFERVFDDLSSQLEFHLPPMIMRANNPSSFQHVKVLPPPPIGCFEVVFRPYLSDESMLIHSKLKSKWFPLASDMVRQLSNLMLPEDLLFANHSMPILEVIVFNSYYRKPVANAEVIVYRVTVNTAKKYSNLHRARSTHVYGHGSNVHHTSADTSPNKKDEKGSHLKTSHKTHLKSVTEKGSPHTKQQSSSPPVTLPNTVRHRLSSISQEHLKLLSSQTFEDALLRHSSAYYRVRTWSKEDIVKWLEFYNVSPNVIKEAIREGVVDGPSFLKLVTSENLKRWGLRSRGIINHVIDGINSLKLGDHLLDNKDGNLHSSQSAIALDGLDALTSPTWNFAASDLKSTVKFSSPSKSAIDLDSTTIINDNRKDSINRFHTQYLNFEKIVRGATSRTGIYRCHNAITQSGAYIFTVVSPTMETYSSHIFNFNTPCRLGYALTLKPSLEKIYFIIKGSNAGLKSHLEQVKRSIRFGHDDSSFFMTVRNVQTFDNAVIALKKVYISENDDDEEDKPKPMSRKTSTNDYTSPKYLFSQYQSNNGNSLPSLQNPTNHRSSIGPSTNTFGSINQQLSASSNKKVNFFDATPMSQNSSAYSSPKVELGLNNPRNLSNLVQSSPTLSKIFWKEGQSPSSTNSMVDDNRKYFYIGEATLPCGSYLSEMDGTIFQIKSNAQDAPNLEAMLDIEKSINLAESPTDYFPSLPFGVAKLSENHIPDRKPSLGHLARVNTLAADFDAIFIPLQTEKSGRPSILRNDSKLSSQLLAYIESQAQTKNKSESETTNKSHIKSQDKSSMNSLKNKTTLKFIVYQEKYFVKLRQKKVLSAIAVLENWWYSILGLRSRQQMPLQNISDDDNKIGSKASSPRPQDLNFIMRTGVEGFVKGFRTRRIIKIQTFFRCYYYRNRYRLLRHLIVSLQALWRRYKATTSKKRLLAIVAEEARRKREEQELERILKEQERLKIEKQQREEKERLQREEEERKLRMAAVAAAAKHKEPSPWDKFMSYLDDDKQGVTTEVGVPESVLKPSTSPKLKRNESQVVGNVINPNPRIESSPKNDDYSVSASPSVGNPLSSLVARIKSPEIKQLSQEYRGALEQKPIVNEEEELSSNNEMSVTSNETKIQKPRDLSVAISGSSDSFSPTNKSLGGAEGPKTMKTVIRDDIDDEDRNSSSLGGRRKIVPFKLSSPTSKSSNSVGLSPSNMNLSRNDNENVKIPAENIELQGKSTVASDSINAINSNDNLGDSHASATEPISKSNENQRVLDSETSRSLNSARSSFATHTSTIISSVTHRFTDLWSKTPKSERVISTDNDIGLKRNSVSDNGPLNSAIVHENVSQRNSTVYNLESSSVTVNKRDLLTLSRTRQDYQESPSTTGREVRGLQGDSAEIQSLRISASSPDVRSSHNTLNDAEGTSQPSPKENESESTTHSSSQLNRGSQVSPALFEKMHDRTNLPQTNVSDPAPKTYLNQSPLQPTQVSKVAGNVLGSSDPQAVDGALDRGDDVDESSSPMSFRRSFLSQSKSVDSDEDDDFITNKSLRISKNQETDILSNRSKESHQKRPKTASPRRSTMTFHSSSSDLEESPHINPGKNDTVFSVHRDSLSNKIDGNRNSRRSNGFKTKDDSSSQNEVESTSSRVSIGKDSKSNRDDRISHKGRVSLIHSLYDSSDSDS